MPRQIAIIASVLFTLGLATTATASEAKWSIAGEYIDSCSCNPACPCFFGSPSTKKGMCQGVTLLDVSKGEYEGVKLDGVKILVVYHGGKWQKIYVDEDASRDQLDAAKKLLPDMSAFFATAKIIEVNRVKIDVARKGEEIKITAPKTHLEIKQMKSVSGQSIKIENMPAHGFDGPALHDFTQHVSVKVSHDSKDKDEKFKYAGTSGFTANIDASSEDSESE